MRGLKGKCNRADAVQVENFWILAYALRHFHYNYDFLPLPGYLPDMKAQSDVYIQLQNIYKAKARKDILEITQKVRKVETDLENKSRIDEREIEAFCKNAAFIKLILGRPMHLPNWPGKGMYGIHRAEWMYKELLNADSLLPIYLSFMAYDVAIGVPGTPREEEDAQARLARNMTKITDDFFLYLPRAVDKIAAEKMVKIEFDPEPARARTHRVGKEILRASGDGGGAELHNISAVMGGMVAQEVIKVVTEQYVPVNNVCVFDGIESRVGVFTM